MPQVEVLSPDFKSAKGKTARKGTVYVRSGGTLLERPSEKPLRDDETLAPGIASSKPTLSGREAFDNYNTAAKAKLERYQSLSAEYLSKGDDSINQLQAADAGIILEESEDAGFSPEAQSRIRKAKRAGVNAQLDILGQKVGSFERRQQTFLQTWQTMGDIMKDLYKDDLDTPPQNVLNSYKAGLESGALTLQDIPVEDMKYVLPLVDFEKLPNNDEEIDIFNDASGNRLRVTRDSNGLIKTTVIGKVRVPGSGGRQQTSGERTTAKFAAISGQINDIIGSEINEGETSGTFTTIAAYNRAKNVALQNGIDAIDFDERYAGSISEADRRVYQIAKPFSGEPKGGDDSNDTVEDILADYEAYKNTPGVTEGELNSAKEEIRIFLFQNKYNNDAASDVISRL